MTTFTGLSSITGLGSMSFTAAQAHPVPAAGEIVFTTNWGSGKTFGLQYGNDQFGGQISCFVESTTGYVKVEWWDGTSEVKAHGSDGAYFNKYFSAVNYASPGNASANLVKQVTEQYANVPKDVRFYACTSQGTKSGIILKVALSESDISYIDCSQCSSLTHLQCYGQMYDSGSPSYSSSSSLELNLNNCTYLTYLKAGQCDISSIDLSDCSSLINMDFRDNPTGGYSFLNPVKSIVEYLEIGNSGGSSLDLSNASSLIKLNIYNISESVVNLSNCTNLRWCYANGSALESLTATNVGAGMDYSSYSSYSSIGSGFSLNNCNLDNSALNAFYTSLGSGAGLIAVSGNPGASGDDPSIATAKGWTVLG